MYPVVAICNTSLSSSFPSSSPTCPLYEQTDALFPPLFCDTDVMSMAGGVGGGGWCVVGGVGGAGMEGGVDVDDEGCVGVLGCFVGIS